MKTRPERKSLLYMGYASHRIRRELARCANQYNWTITVGHLQDFDAKTYAAQIPVHGVISHAAVSLTKRLLGLFPDRPFVTLSADVAEAFNMPGVVMDHLAAGRLVGQHFVELGFENCIAIDWHDYISDVRYLGLSQALNEAGSRTPNRIEVKNSDLARLDKGLLLLIKILRNVPIPTAIMAHTDNLAAMLVHACQHADLAVPAQIAICGFDNDPIACEMAPMPLSSIDTDPELQVREAARIMDEMLNGGTPPRQTIRIQPKGIVVRQTSGTVAVGDPTLSKALSYVHNHIRAADLSIREVAQAIGVSDVSLFTAFRRSDCGTPLQYITNIRVKKATSLLRETTGSIDDIRYECGFASYNQMYKAFKRTTGKNPTSFREAIKRNG